VILEVSETILSWIEDDMGMMVLSLVERHRRCVVSIHLLLLVLGTSVLVRLMMTRGVDIQTSTSSIARKKQKDELKDR
jgi:hypothetical protein